MNYYIEEIEVVEKFKKNAGSKARLDVDKILHDKIKNSISIPFDINRGLDASKIQKYFDQKKKYKMWKQKLANLSAGDMLFVQYPIMANSMNLYKLFRKLNKRGIKLVFIVHDIQSLRLGNPSYMMRYKNKREEVNILNESYKIILHNEKMINWMSNNSNYNINKDAYINLNIFDYLCDFDNKQDDNGVIIAGNLDSKKARYLSELPRNIKFNLYGVNYDKNNFGENVNYMGSFMPNELPNKLMGKFGLVWDGISSNTCDGTMGKYLAYNNPHKTSLYIASEIPVIIWEDAALASFIRDKKLGITVKSLSEIKEKIESISDEEYRIMKENLKIVASRMRNGLYMSEAIDKALE